MLRRVLTIDTAWGITALRLATAIIFIVAGWLKYVAGAAVVAGAFASLGVPFAALSARFILGLELVGGVLLLFGIATRWLGLLFAIESLVALLVVKPKWSGFNDGPVELMLLAGGILLFIAGPGKASVDELWLEKPR
jgi:putative oxidoreductase